MRITKTQRQTNPSLRPPNQARRCRFLRGLALIIAVTATGCHAGPANDRKGRTVTAKGTGLGGAVDEKAEKAGEERARASKHRGPELSSELQTAIDLANRGNLKEAEEKLREILAKRPQARRTRQTLARVLVHTGRSEQGAKLLRQGIQGEEADFDLWLAIAGIRMQLATEGTSVKRVGDWVQHKVPDDPNEEARYKKEQAKLAFEAYRSAWKIRKDSLQAVAGMAEASSLQGKHSQAVKIWKALIDSVPTNAHVWSKYGAALQAAGRDKEAIRAYEKTVAIDPRLSSTHEALAKHYAEQSQPKKAALAKKKAAFYGWLPKFTKIRYSEERMQTLSGLRSKKAAARKATLTRLIADSSREATEMLAAICWHHMEHGAGEYAAFQALEKRKAVDLLKHLVSEAQSVCTIRQGIAALTRLRAPGIYKILIELLPSDVRPGFPMQVAKCLAMLGDERAVPHLVKVVEHPLPKLVKGSLNSFAIIGRQAAKERAIIALSHFNTKQALNTLKRATRDKDLQFYALVGLYCLTKKASHLKRAEAWIRANPEAILSEYLIQERLGQTKRPESRRLLKLLTNHAKQQDEKEKDSSEK